MIKANGNDLTMGLGMKIARLRPRGYLDISWSMRPRMKGMSTLIRGSNSSAITKPNMEARMRLCCASFLLLEVKIYTAKTIKISGKEVHLIKANPADTMIKIGLFLVRPNSNKR